MSTEITNQEITGGNDNTSNNSQAEELKETKWTDSAIRWSEDENKATEDDDDDEESTGLVDPFADPDPSQTFDFEFVVNDSTTIQISLDGYKYESDQTWNSTGLTLWRAARHLCDYLVQLQKGEEGQKSSESLIEMYLRNTVRLLNCPKTN